MNRKEETRDIWIITILLLVVASPIIAVLGLIIISVAGLIVR